MDKFLSFGISECFVDKIDMVFELVDQVTVFREIFMFVSSYVLVTELITSTEVSASGIEIFILAVQELKRFVVGLRPEGCSLNFVLFEHFRYS
jgi:hypothetical protein